MRFEPALDRARLLAAIRGAYDIDAVELRFLPVGFAACYEVRTSDALRYFLKVWTGIRLGTPEARRQLASLALSGALHERVPALHVAHPLPTRDRSLWLDLEGMPLGLFPFLSGTVHTSWSDALRDDVARALAALHRATPLVRDLLAPPEPFEIAFEPELRRHLEVAAAVGPGDRPGLHAIGEWVVRNRDDVLAQLARLHDLQVVARALDGPLVLCHTDLHGNNVLVDESGQLHLLDWDDAKLAPPEHDLWIGLSEGAAGGDATSVQAFLDAYRAAGGVGTLHLDHFAFYLLRRYLEDLTVTLDLLLAPEADPRDDELRLGYLRAARWSRLDDTLAVLEAALGKWGS